jgi:ammonia channel protein AmtB
MIGLGFGALSMFGSMGQFAGTMMGNAVRKQEQQDKIRSLGMRKAAVVGLAAAKSGASGVEGTSASTVDYLSGLGAEFDRTIFQQKRANADLNRAANVSAISGLIGGGAGTIAGLGELNNWNFG